MPDKSAYSPSADETADWIGRIAVSGDRQAFEQVFRYYAPRLKSYLARGGGSAAAEELVQETMVAVWRKAAQFDPARSSASTWIFTIARNLRIDAYRRERRPEYDAEDPAFVPEPEPAADAAIERRQTAEAVATALGSLSEAEQSILRLAYFEDQPQSAISRLLGIPLGTVKSRVRLAFGKLTGGHRRQNGRTAMSTRHHVSDELLLGYEAGTLAEGWSLAIATHLALCPACRRQARAMAEVGGALLDGTDTGDLSEDVFDWVLRRIDAPPADVPPPAPASRPTRAVLPEPLRGYLGGDLETLRWKRLGTGAHQILIRTDDRETSVRMLRIAAGQPVPEHGHRGQELTVVLCGTLIDGDEVFGRGDVEIADENVEHQPFAGPGEDCICLAVTDAPLRFKHWIVRLAQPFLRI